jgi:phosphatidate cytidylyltransferase
MAFLIHLRLLHADRWGLLAVISVLVVVKMADTGAYFVGRRWGRRSLAPVLSPKKTIEGSIGALLAGCIQLGVLLRGGRSSGIAGNSGGWGWSWLRTEPA